jgi:hypothetical protein
MPSRPENQAGLRNSIAKGISIGFLIFFIFSLQTATPAHAVSGDHWMIGTYYRGTYTGGSLSGVSDVGANFYNTGMPAPSGKATYAVLSASFNGTSSVPWIPQVSIENINDGSYVGYYLFAVLLDSGGQIYAPFNGGTKFYANQVSGLSNSWHVLKLGTTSLVVGNTNYEYLSWYLDGTAYISWQIATCTTPCSFSSTPYYVNKWIAPNMGVESYDTTNSDFTSFDVHGYFKVSGTDTSNMYLYGANYGYNHGCALPSSAQQTRLYLSQNIQGPDNAGLTGYIYSTSHTYGAPNEWGIGPFSLYRYIRDADLNSNFCNPIPQVA